MLASYQIGLHGILQFAYINSYIIAVVKGNNVSNASYSIIFLYSMTDYNNLH